MVVKWHPWFTLKGVHGNPRRGTDVALCDLIFPGLCKCYLEPLNLVSHLFMPACRLMAAIARPTALSPLKHTPLFAGRRGPLSGYNPRQTTYDSSGWCSRVRRLATSLWLTFLCVPKGLMILGVFLWFENLVVDICKRNDDQIPTKNPPSKYLVITQLILREDLGDT